MWSLNIADTALNPIQSINQPVHVMICNYVTTIKALFFFLQMTSNESLQYAQHFVMSGYCGTNAIYYCKDCSKKLWTDCRFYHNEKTDIRYHTVVSFHEENRDEGNNADDVNVMATNDIWDESDRSYPVSDDVDSDDGSDADVHIAERTLSRARSNSFAILVESFRFQVPSPNC